MLFIGNAWLSRYKMMGFSSKIKTKLYSWKGICRKLAIQLLKNKKILLGRINRPIWKIKPRR